MTRERQRFWLWASAAMLAGLLLRLWFIRHLSHVAGDSFVYGDIAKNLLLHKVYGFTEKGPTSGSIMIRPTLIRLPGYPLFLAACFHLFGMESYRSALYVQIVADLLTCWLASVLAGRLFGRRAALFVLWIAALCPFTATYVATPLTETFVLTTIALAFYAFARWQQAGPNYNRWLWLIVIALASSILLRPEQGLLAAVIIPAMLWTALAAPERRKNVFHSAAPILIASLCILLPLLPWTARNWHTFHVFQPLAPRSATDPSEPQLKGFGRWYRGWAIDFASTDRVYWNYQVDRIEPADLPTRAFTLSCIPDSTPDPDLHARTIALLHDYNRKTTSSPTLDARFANLANERIHSTPICYYVALPIARLFNMMLRPRTDMTEVPLEWWKWSKRPAQTIFATACAALNLAYFALAAVGVLAWRRRNWLGARELAWAIAAYVLLRCVLLLTLDNSEPRYTLEFFPIIFVCAGALFAQTPTQQSPQQRVL
jgi:4-amino-4-deoxy-L-arabinose transferase-like glycosyltransferase